MNIRNILFLALWFYAFTAQITEKPIDTLPKEQYEIDFQHLLDEAKVEGSILIYDAEQDTYFSNDFNHAKKQFIPASTFKVPNTLIALELGIAENESTLFQWDGVERSIANWNQNLTLKQAFHYSCVPCYQQIAREVGVTQMVDLTDQFNYGDLDIDSANIDQFWLLGNSKISSYEQIAFLKSYVEEDFPISKNTYNIARDLMISDQGQGYTITAKTGWSQSGVWWYVGFVETEGKVYYFATNLKENPEVDANVRKEVTLEALRAKGILPQLRP